MKKLNLLDPRLTDELLARITEYAHEVGADVTIHTNQDKTVCVHPTSDHNVGFVRNTLTEALLAAYLPGQGPGPVPERGPDRGQAQKED